MVFNVLLVKKECLKSIFVVADFIKITTEGIFTYSKYKYYANVIDVLYITKYWYINKLILNIHFFYIYMVKPKHMILIHENVFFCK